MRDRRDGRTTLCPGRRLRSLQYPTQGVGTTEEHQNRSQQRHQHEQQAHGVPLHKVMKRVRKDSAVTASHASNSVRATGPPYGNSATPKEQQHHQQEQQAHGVTLHKVMKRVLKDSAVPGSLASNSVRATGPPVGNPATPKEKRHPGRGGVFAAWSGAAYLNRTDDLFITSESLYRLS